MKTKKTVEVLEAELADAMRAIAVYRCALLEQNDKVKVLETKIIWKEARLAHAMNSSVKPKQKKSYTIQELDKNIEDGCFGEGEIFGGLREIGYYEELVPGSNRYTLTKKGEKNLVADEGLSDAFSKKTLKRLRKHFQE